MPISNIRPDITHRASLLLGTPYSTPDGKLEKTIAEIFAEVFNLDEAGAFDDFFDLGGDSLNAEVLSMRISERTKYEFQPSWLLDSGSPRQIAQLLSKKPVENLMSNDAHREGSRPPIFVVHGRGGEVLLARAPSLRRDAPRSLRPHDF